MRFFVSLRMTDSVVFILLQLPILICLCFLVFFESGLAYADYYIDSAHGNKLHGVKRSSMGAYAVTNCSHCHSRAAMGGRIAFGPSSRTRDVSSPAGNICLDCHTDIDSHQKGGVRNRSYSFRAGGWTADSLDSIQKAFSFTDVSAPAGSSHNLEDIIRFVSDKWKGRYRESSNPCCACHNPHAAQGDPLHMPVSAKRDSQRGWPLTLPGKRGSKVAVDILYGDNNTSPNERMNNYNYQSPYRYNKIGQNEYEPDGSITMDGSNLTDFVTFCTECHTRSDDITTSNQNIIMDSIGNGSRLARIDWDIALHGKADGGGKKNPPYTGARNYVLSCTDCHEPHGSQNLYLIRQEINGASGVALTKNTRDAWNSACIPCHRSKLAAPYCPGDDGSKVCSGCHYHGKNF
jgi:hypothetical protein